MPLIKPLIVQTSINYTVAEFVSIVEVTTGSGANIEITLPANAANSDRIIEIVKVDSGTKFVEIKRAGADTIRGSATSIYAIQQGESIILKADGAGEWVLLGDPYRTEAARISSGTSPVVSRSTSTFMTVSHISTGKRNITFLTGVFLDTPFPSGLVESASFGRTINVDPGGTPSNTALRVHIVSDTGTSDNADFNIEVIGKK